MKRLTATLASVSLALAVGAPIASAKHMPAKQANHAASARQTVLQPGKFIAAKQPGKKLAVHLAKYMRAS